MSVNNDPGKEAMLAGASNPREDQGIEVIEVIEAYGQGRVNRRVLVGGVATHGPWVEGADGLRRRLLRYALGSRLVVDYWTCNAYGTTQWRVCVCESAVRGQGVVLPAIRPAVTLLADIHGAPRVRAFLAWLRGKSSRIERFTHAEWARIELHFQRMPMARLRSSGGAKAG
jgi:hypothetical protein